MPKTIYRFLWLLTALTAAVGAAPGQTRSEPPELLEATIPELQQALASEEVTSVDLVRMYLRRIEAYDRYLNSMVYVNPTALDRAEALDRERREAGPRGPLHGIPIVVKDNYDTGDMPTTGGSLALAGLVPPDDAYQVRKLREAGAIIIGKTNLHELAAGITTISSFGGQTRNPYDPGRNPGGSSGGTGAAVAANFAAAGMGSDTCGSIRIPASHNGLVGLRGTAGLSSRDGIIPLSHTQDIGGPLTRTVTDLAIMLDATVGPDPGDPVTARSAGHVPRSYTEFLNAEGLRGARIGILKEAFGDAPEDKEVAEAVMAAVEEMKSLGAETIEVDGLGLTESLEDASVITHEFKFDLMDYLAATPGAPVRSLGEILERGLYHQALQERFEERNAPQDRDSEAYRKALARQEAFRATLLGVVNERSLDALLYPTIRRKPALIGEPQLGSNCLISAASGFPAVSVPAGFTADELPVGVELLGPPFGEPRLMELAYAFEQASRHRRPPSTTPPLVEGRVPRFELTVVATGAQCVPPTDSRALARGRLTFDPPTRRLAYSFLVSELQEGEVGSIGIHRGEKGANGPVLHILEPGLTGATDVTEPERKDLMAGRLYLVFYTGSHPQGGLCGPIVPE